ncbi:hypothetical protein IP88_06355 [alpha proteobacterium AAP81b]|nr:hypothetical protein IP88_06355 [alpha proteobacterium AAP81b]
MRPQLVATAAALFAGAPDWPALAASGLPLLLVPEASGGFGGDWGDAAAVLREAGRAALAAPLGETMVASKLVAGARASVQQGQGTLAVATGWLTATQSVQRFNGSARGVAWGAAADWLVAGHHGRALLISTYAATAGANPAGEPRDSLVLDAAPTLVLGRADVLELGAFVRVAQIAGGLEAALALAVDHVNSRVQFGKPLARQQAIQQQLAVLAGEVAAAGMASAAAARALDASRDARFEIAAAKLRANLAVARGVGIAHQVHGAIGFTMDYPLQRLTRRLIGWRSEFGGDAFWAARLGQRALALGGAGLWAEMARQGDR